MSARHAILFSDGGSRGNPGPAAIGAVLKDAKGTKLGTVSRTIGRTTNNQAEYQALLAGLMLALHRGVTHLECFLDSELVVKQLNREYKVKDLGIQSQFVKVWNLCLCFASISFVAVPRSKNKEADRLVNLALDQEEKSTSSPSAVT